MIRIVDILKKISEQNAEKKLPEKPTPKFSKDDAGALIGKLANSLDALLGMKESGPNADEAGKSVLSGIKDLVEQQTLNNTPLFLDLLKKREQERSTPALRIAVVSVKMGMDVNYNKDKLIELFTASLIGCFEENRLLRETIASGFNAAAPEYKKIFALAKFYKS